MNSKQIKSLADWIISFGIGPIFIVSIAAIVVNNYSAFCDPKRIASLFLLGIIFFYSLINIRTIRKGSYPPNIENIGVYNKQQIRKIFLAYMICIQLITILIYIFSLMTLPIIFLCLLLINFLTSIFLLWKSKFHRT